MLSLAVSWTKVRGLESCRLDLWSQDSVWLQRDAGWLSLEARLRLGFWSSGGRGSGGGWLEGLVVVTG